MAFKENINKICKLRGTNLTQLIKECGYSSSKVTAINQGQLPNEEQLLTFAKYLKCSVMDFFEDEDTVDSIFSNEDEKTLIEGFRTMPKSQQYRLMAYYYQLLEGRE